MPTEAQAPIREFHISLIEMNYTISIDPLVVIILGNYFLEQRVMSNWETQLGFPVYVDQ